MLNSADNLLYLLLKYMVPSALYVCVAELVVLLTTVPSPKSHEYWLILPASVLTLMLVGYPLAVLVGLTDCIVADSVIYIVSEKSSCPSDLH